jgi:hypothetical protein
MKVVNKEFLSLIVLPSASSALSEYLQPNVTSTDVTVASKLYALHLYYSLCQ